MEKSACTENFPIGLGVTLPNGDYYPFGKTSRSSLSSNSPREKFTGYQHDDESDLEYGGSRYYNAGISRFISIDPMASKYPQWSPYIYAGNMPTSHIDLNGEGPWGPILGGALVGALVEAGSQWYQYGEIKDPTDVAISAVIGAISGGGGALIESFTGKVAINAIANVFEEGAKANYGSQTNEYTIENAVGDALLGGVAAALGERAKTVAQGTEKRSTTHEDGCQTGT